MPSYRLFDTLNACYGIPINFRNRWVSKDTWVVDSLKTIYGCDSIIYGLVRFNQVVREELTKVKCIGDDFSFLKKKYSRPGIFFDTIRSSMGCDSVIYQLTLIDDNCGLTVYIPTAFTPNSVGPKANNVFMPFMDNHASFILKIFNRWG
jgi:hypothetical protein